MSRPASCGASVEHRLLCGDARRPADYRNCSGEEADLIFTDPPYNVPVAGHVGGHGAIKHLEFTMASGEMSEAEYSIFSRPSATRPPSHAAAPSHFICIEWRRLFRGS